MMGWWSEWWGCGEGEKNEISDERINDVYDVTLGEL